MEKAMNQKANATVKVAIDAKSLAEEISCGKGFIIVFVTNAEIKYVWSLSKNFSIENAQVIDILDCGKWRDAYTNEEMKNAFLNFHESWDDQMYDLFVKERIADAFMEEYGKLLAEWISKAQESRREK